MTETLTFAKGHGTGNDFVLVPDPDGTLPLDAALVVALCDRRFGVGGDGVLRVVRAAAEPEAAGMADEAEWFMDYRNADGSLAEMCGNGVRVYARYLVESGLAPGNEPGLDQVPREHPHAVAAHLGDRAVGVAVVHEPFGVGLLGE